MADKYFPKVREAREALRARAMEIFELQMQVAREALAAENFEQANIALQFLLKHMPKDEDGLRLLESDPDKEGGKQIPAGPTIQIGIALGPQKKALPEVIDITGVDIE